MNVVWDLIPKPDDEWSDVAADILKITNLNSMRIFDFFKDAFNVSTDSLLVETKISIGTVYFLAAGDCLCKVR